MIFSVVGVVWSSETAAKTAAFMLDNLGEERQGGQRLRAFRAFGCCFCFYFEARGKWSSVKLTVFAVIYHEVRPGSARATRPERSSPQSGALRKAALPRRGASPTGSTRGQSAVYCNGSFKLSARPTGVCCGSYCI